MAEDIPEWLAAAAPISNNDDARHLRVLRAILAKDYLAKADWQFARGDVARMARVGLEADRTLVATFDPEAQRWSAVSSEGTAMDPGAISDYGSLATLESVRRTEEPVLTTTDIPLAFRSQSMNLNDVGSVLAVPLFGWDVDGDHRTRRLSGCLYAHRTARRPVFTQKDVALVLDIARLAQPTLNALEHLAALEALHGQQQRELEALRLETSERLGSLKSRDPLFARHVLGRLRRIAQADRVGLLILGPTGSGKSHLARAYHNECRRRSGPFVTFDCGQVTSATTLAAELFGYAPRSGYANAPPAGRPGKAELANGGTLFIDEIGALPTELQQRLLRLVQHGVYSPVGNAREKTVDIQIIAATNEPLGARVRGGQFREDLFWRLGEVTVNLPPLDKRPADVPQLAQRFLAKASARFDRASVTGFTRAALDRLIRHPWSRCGNIRGLEQVVVRSVLLATVARLDAADLELEDPFSYHAFAEGDRADSSTPTDTVERKATGTSSLDLRPFLVGRLAHHDYNVRAVAADPTVAERFGYPQPPVPTTSLYNRLRELGLLAALDGLRQSHGSFRLDRIAQAVREHGSGAAAARALGMTRDALVWQLRKANTSISEVLNSHD